MKKLTYEEFQKRINEVNKAARIFKPLTNNLTEAFALYQQVLAEDEEQMKVMVTTREFGNRPMTPLDDYERPHCPECGTELRLKFGKIQDSDEKIWNSAWVCEKCKAEFYSDKTLDDWMRELKRVSE